MSFVGVADDERGFLLEPRLSMLDGRDGGLTMGTAPVDKFLGCYFDLSQLVRRRYGYWLWLVQIHCHRRCRFRRGPSASVPRQILSCFTRHGCILNCEVIRRQFHSSSFRILETSPGEEEATYSHCSTRNFRTTFSSSIFSNGSTSIIELKVSLARKTPEICDEHIPAVSCSLLQIARRSVLSRYEHST